MLGEEIARELIEALSVKLSISSARLLAAMRDRFSEPHKWGMKAWVLADLCTGYT
jgi:hypothetical protein